MILGVGIDIIETERVAEKLNKPGFKEKVFSRGELNYCQSQTDPAQHFAARFATKEAFLKAAGKGLQLSHDLADIEIVLNTDGKPEIALHNQLTSLFQNHRFHVSLSHVQATACAVVIIETIPS